MLFKSIHAGRHHACIPHLHYFSARTLQYCCMMSRHDERVGMKLKIPVTSQKNIKYDDE